jgi:hypothetical protein
MSRRAADVTPPTISAVDLSLLRQPTGQYTVSDRAVAQRQYETAKTVHASAKKRLKQIRRLAQYRRVRVWAAQRGIAGWVAALAVGSVTALLLAVLLIFVAGAGIGGLFAGILLAYVMVGGSALWFFRRLDCETDENCIQVRTDQLRQAGDDCRSAQRVAEESAVHADSALKLLRSIDQVLQSELNKRLIETNRLLGVEAGRLYPDEFERYVADVFRHLGFTVDVTGKTGDQGVDVLASRGPLRLAIQAKRYDGLVGNAAIQQVYAGMAHHRCQRCVVVTTSDFTSAAIALAESTNCILVDAKRIPALVRGEIQF